MKKETWFYLGLGLLLYWLVSRAKAPLVPPGTPTPAGSGMPTPPLTVAPKPVTTVSPAAQPPAGTATGYDKVRFETDPIYRRAILLNPAYRGQTTPPHLLVP